MTIKHKIIPYLYHRSFFDNLETMEELFQKIINEGNLVKNISINYFDGLSEDFKIKNKKRIDKLSSSRYNTMVGDIFEFFSLVFLNYYGKNFDITDIRSSSCYVKNDYGVDAYGTDTISVKKVAVQMKFRSDISSEITYGDLTSFATEALSGGGNDELKVDNYNYTMLVTTASGLNYHAKNRFSINGKMRVINFNDIKSKVNHRIDFWNYIRKELLESYNSIEKDEFNGLHLRDYQEKIVNDFKDFLIPDNNFRKQFILPTAAGKSLVQSSFIDSAIDNGSKIILSVAPTIALVNQLGNVYSKNIRNNIYSYIVSSEGTKDNDGIQHIDNSTNIIDIIEKIMEAETYNLPIVISSTYKSFSRVLSAVSKINKKIDLCILDEAQHSVKSENFNILKLYDETKILTNIISFTATPKYHPADGTINNLPSMRNELIYGTQYIVTVKDLTDKGYLAKIAMTFVDSNSGRNSDKASKDTILDIINEYFEKIKKYSEVSEVISYSYDEIMSIIFSIESHIKKIRNFKNKDMKAKIIISCSSVSRAHLLSNILDHIFKLFDDEIYDENWFIDSISSDSVLTTNFTKTGNRDSTLENFKNKDTNSIVCHYNVLSEGIDVPGCTAVILLRGMNDILICQTIGRTVRRTLKDIEFHNQIYNTPNYKNLYIDNTECWEKPFGYVIIPVYGDSENMKNIVHDILTKICSGEQDYVFGELDFVSAGNKQIESNSSRIIDIKNIVESEFNKLKITFNYKEDIFYYNLKEEVKEKSNNMVFTEDYINLIKGML